MHILVNNVRLFFEVAGTKLRVDGPAMREVPTLVMVHGGPGVDHSIYRPAFDALADVAQVVYYDNRGCGRSEHGPQEQWTLAQWADDLKAFCDALGIVKPVVYGASFGGFVAMAYGIRHATHPGGLVLVSTTAQGAAHKQAKVAMFAQLGGEAAGALAHRRFIQGDTSREVLMEWLKIAVPHYTQQPPVPGGMERLVLHPEVTAWFNREGGEGRSFDMLADLAKVQCPTLVLGGQLDPMTPIECQRDIAAAIPPHLMTYQEYAHCGHGVMPDVPHLLAPLLREFITKHGI